MSDIIAAVGAWPLLPVALLIWGFAPGLVNRLIALGYSRRDPRREEMIAELYAVPRWERPFWVAEQLERLITEGLPDRVRWFIEDRVTYRWHLGDGVARNAEYPDSFDIPEQADRDGVLPGDHVKLMFEMRRARPGEPGAERMWVAVTGLRKHGFEGRLLNFPVFVGGLYPDDIVRFEAKHIIDIVFADEMSEDGVAPSPAPADKLAGIHAGCNGHH